MTNSVRTILGIFLILHGIAHIGLSFAPYPQSKEAKPGSWFGVSANSWLLKQLGVHNEAIQPTLIVPWIVVGVLVAASGLSTLGFILPTSLSSMLVLISSVASLALLFVFWHPWLILGVVIDASLIFTLLAGSWTPTTPA